MTTEYDLITIGAGSGGVRAPLHCSAITGDEPPTILVPVVAMTLCGSPVTMELVSASVVPSGIVPALRSSVRKPTSQ